MADTNTTALSFQTLRRIVGILGIALPILVAIVGAFVLGHFMVLPAISDYYDLRTRDIFVGILFTIGWFLFAYRGYDSKDALLGKIAGVSALLIALFPNSGTVFDHFVHVAGSIVLFQSLAYYTLFQFTKTVGTPTPQKLARNRIYNFCGYTMLGCMIIMGIAELHPKWFFPNVLFAGETLTLWAFGFSWLVKGNTFWKDKPNAG
jgi:hypothetical protein